VPLEQDDVAIAQGTVETCGPFDIREQKGHLPSGQHGRHTTIIPHAVSAGEPAHGSMPAGRRREGSPVGVSATVLARRAWGGCRSDLFAGVAGGITEVERRSFSDTCLEAGRAEASADPVDDLIQLVVERGGKWSVAGAVQGGGDVGLVDPFEENSRRVSGPR
jgi:hypothetical protein